MLYVINLIVPLFYLLVLDLTSFFINEARGEKLGFKVTVLLSISVLLLILQDMLPSTEDQLPMIGEQLSDGWSSTSVCPRAQRKELELVLYSSPGLLFRLRG